jgi:hypothetical protein
MDVISHAAPTDWIRLPKFDTRLPIHTLRKIGVWKGDVLVLAAISVGA